MKLRQWVLKLHGLIGIGMGLLLVIVSLSGAGIVFHKEFDQVFNRSLFHITPQAEQVSLDAMLAPVLAAHPDLPVWFIQVPTEPNQSFVINQKMPNEHRLQTFVNPYTGEVLGSRIWERSIVGFLYTLHHDLFAGTVGQILIGVTGVFLLLLGVTGILLWRGWRKLANGYKIRWQAPFSLFSYDIHQLGGILSSVFFLVISFTGVVIVIVHFLPMFNQAPAEKLADPRSRVALSTLMQKADQAIPDGKTTFIEFPEHQPEKFVVRKRLPDQETGIFDLSVVELDRYSSEITQVSKVTKPDGFFKFLVAIADLHFGTFGGLATRILYLVIGLMPTVLLVTGLVMWKRKRILRRAG